MMSLFSQEHLDTSRARNLLGTPSLEHLDACSHTANAVPFCEATLKRRGCLRVGLEGFIQ